MNKFPETSSIQHPATNIQRIRKRRSLDVRCWLSAVGCFFFFAFATFGATNETQTVSAVPVLQQLRQKMAAVKSVSMTFTQERVLKLFSEPLKSEGMMFLERPGKIRWETTSPYQTILIGDQKSASQFEFTDGKWQKLKLGFSQMLQRLMQQMSAMNQGDLNAMTKDYDVSVKTNGETVFTLVPKDPNVKELISSLEIHLSPDLVNTREVVMNEPNGDLTRITFQDEKRDVTFPPGTFGQNKPLDISAVKAALKNAP